MTTDAGWRGYVRFAAVTVCVVVYICVARIARRSAVIMRVLARRLPASARRTERRTQTKHFSSLREPQVASPRLADLQTELTQQQGLRHRTSGWPESFCIRDIKRLCSPMAGGYNIHILKFFISTHHDCMSSASIIFLTARIPFIPNHLSFGEMRGRFSSFRTSTRTVSGFAAIMTLSHIKCYLRLRTL